MHEKRQDHLPKQALFLQLIQPNQFLVILTFLTFYFYPEVWFLPLIVFIYLIVHRSMAFMNTQYVQKDDVLEIRSGVWIKKTFLTKRDNIDEMVVSQTFLQKKLRLASIRVTSRDKNTLQAELEHISSQAAQDIWHWYTDYAYRLSTYTKHET